MHFCLKPNHVCNHNLCIADILDGKSIDLIQYLFEEIKRSAPQRHTLGLLEIPLRLATLNTQCQSSCISEDEGTPSFLLLLPLELDKCSSKVALELSGTFIVFFSTSAHTWHQGLHGMVTVTSETWLLLSNNAYFLLSAEFLRGFSTKSGLRKFLKADIPLEAGFRFSLFGS